MKRHSSRRTPLAPSVLNACLKPWFRPRSKSVCYPTLRSGSFMAKRAPSAEAMAVPRRSSVASTKERPHGMGQRLLSFFR